MDIDYGTLYLPPLSTHTIDLPVSTGKQDHKGEREEEKEHEKTDRTNGLTSMCFAANLHVPVRVTRTSARRHKQWNTNS